jgi:glycosyltransferase involved in cell wall biosynthesis
MLSQLLSKLENQETDGLFVYSIVIVDNDKIASAQQTTKTFAQQSKISIAYYVEPEQNIALARNKAIENSKGDFVCFIDDDEYPADDWLMSLYKTCTKSGTEGVLGPVRPFFKSEPPKWVARGRIFERPTHETGYRINLSDARTGNVLFRKRILEGVLEPFRAEYGTGGEDVDFFLRMMDKGYAFIWCNEAVVYEVIPPTRCKRSYLLRRALLRGGNSLRQQVGSMRKIVKSMIAIPVYASALPFFLLSGHHLFMKYLIKTCDHIGVLFALLGFNSPRKRDT